VLVDIGNTFWILYFMHKTHLLAPSLGKRGGIFFMKNYENTRFLLSVLKNGIIFAVICIEFCSPSLLKRRGWGMSYLIKTKD
jgi:hypothetical protein